MQQTCSRRNQGATGGRFPSKSCCAASRRIGARAPAALASQRQVPDEAVPADPGRRSRSSQGTTAKIFDGSAVRERITSCFISRTQRELVPLLSLQSIAITQSRAMAKDDPRLPLLEKQQEDLLPRGGPAVGAGLEGYCWQGHKPAEGGQERLLVEFSAVVADIGRIDPDPLTLDERRA